MQAVINVNNIIKLPQKQIQLTILQPLLKEITSITPFDNGEQAKMQYLKIHEKNPSR